jgi:hypothetical protein
LLTLGARVESLIELQVAQGLKSEGKKMQGLYAGLPKQETATPTAVALLEAIARSEITLTRLEWHGETANPSDAAAGVVAGRAALFASAAHTLY